MLRRLTIAVLASATLPLALAPTAGATGDITVGPSVKPSSGQTVSTTTASLPFTIPTNCIGLSAYVEVASDVQYDLDGTLYSLVTVDRFAVNDLGNGIYEGSATGDWLQTPGSYYWQLNGLGSCGGGPLDLFIGPTTPIVVRSGPVTPPSVEVPDTIAILTISQAQAAVPLAIKNARGRVPRKLVRRCTHAGSGDAAAATCKVTWNDKVQFAYTGTFTLVLDDAGDIVTRFDGRRATLKCLKLRRKIGTRKCWLKHHFDVTL